MISSLSERAQKILNHLLTSPHPDPLPEGEGRPIRQQSLAEQFSCSRRSIGRALKELKNAGLLIDLNKRHKNRCKLYRYCEEPVHNDNIRELTPAGQQLWDRYEKTYSIVFKTSELKKYFTQVTWELRDIKD